MRRSFLAMLGTLTLAACGSHDPGNDVTTDPSRRGPAEANAAHVDALSAGIPAKSAVSHGATAVLTPLTAAQILASETVAPTVVPQGGSLPARVMLDEEGYITSVQQQANRGSCTYFASIGAVESEYLRQYGTRLDLSEEYLINIVSEFFGPDWTGGSVDQKLSFASFYAVPPETAFPYQTFYTGNTVVTEEGVAFGGIDMGSAAGQTLQASLWFGAPSYSKLNNEVASFNSLVAPPPAAHAAAVYGPTSGSVVQIALSKTDPTPLETVLAAGHPIAFMTQMGVWSPSPTGPETAPPAAGYYDLNSTALAQNPPASFDHALLIVGYDSTKRLFRIKNSWGAGWNGNGFADVTYNLLLASITDATYVTQLRNPSKPAFAGSAALRGFWAGVIDGQPGIAVLDHAFANPNEKYELTPHTGYFYANNGAVLPLDWLSSSYDDLSLSVSGVSNITQIFLSGGPANWSYSATNAAGQPVESGTWCRSANHPGTNYLPASYAAAINDPYLFPAGSCTPQDTSAHLVAPFVRHDAVDSVMHYCNGGDLCELSLSPGATHWVLTDMSARESNMPEPAHGPLSAHLRTDGVDSVNFMDVSGAMDEMYLKGGTWGASQYTSATPFFGGKGYSRSDGVNAVVYANASSTSQLTEMSLSSGGWISTNLATKAGAANMVSGIPFGWVREDKVNSVVYVGTDGNLYETYLPLGGLWATDNLSKASGAWTKPVGEPSAYVRSDEVSSVLYRGTDNNVYEAALPAGASWQTSNLHAQCVLHGTTPPPAVTDPQGYKRGDNINAVDFAASNGHIWEMDLISQGWWCGDITARVNAPPMDLLAGSLAPYTRADGISAIVYKGTDGHVWELSLPSSGWSAKDLTADAQ